MSQDHVKDGHYQDAPWYLKFIGPVVFAIFGCALVLAVSGLEKKYSLLLLLTLAAMTLLLAMGRSHRVRVILLFGFGFSTIINPNFFFKLVAVSMIQFAGVIGYGFTLTDLILLALVFLKVIRDRDYETSFAARPPALVLLALGSYGLWICLSLINAADIQLAMVQISFELKLIVTFLLLGYVVLPPGEDGYSDIRIILFGLAAGIAMEAVIVMMEYTGLIPAGFSLFGLQVEGYVEVFAGGLSQNRLGGTFRHPNYLALVMVLMIPIFLSAFLNSGSRKRFFWGLILISATGILLLTLSRGGWLGTAAAALFYSLMTIRSRRGLELIRRNRKAIIASLAVALILVVVFSGPIMTKLFKSDPRNLESRKDLNRLAFYLIEEHPFIGVGMANSNIASQGLLIDQMYRSAFGAPPVIHNIYLLMASEIGVPGLIIFLWILALLLMGAWRSSRRSRDPMTAQLIIGLAAGLFGYLVADFFGLGLRKMEIAHLFWGQLGLLAALTRQSYYADESKRAPF